MTMTLRCSSNPALVLLGCAVAGAVGRAAAYTLPPYPTIRFTSWDDLAEHTRQSARAAGYHEKSWNKVGDLPAEHLDYASLEPEMLSFLESVDIGLESWDCHVNHFRNYEWDDLDDDDPEPLASHEALGWTEDMWCGDEEKPEEEGKYWGDLTASQQEAAANVCYTQELWDDVAIPLWGEDNGVGGVAGEHDAADLYSDEEARVVAEKQRIYTQLYGDDDREMVFNGPASAHNDRGIDVPFFRYDPWELLHPDVRTIAEKAGYDKKTWNAIGTHNMETLDWGMIGDKHPKTLKALRQLGFSEDTWDCYMSHYHTYDWGELKDAGVQQLYRELGYNHNTWDQDLSPEVDGMYWPDLTGTQQEAAYQVGYFRETWDEVSLQFWPRTTSNTASLKDYVINHKAAVGGGTSAILFGLILACVCCYRMVAKNSTSAGAAKEYEMQSGSRFSDYSDGADVVRVRAGSGSDDEGYDEDYQPETGGVRSRSKRDPGMDEDGPEAPPIV